MRSVKRSKGRLPPWDFDRAADAETGLAADADAARKMADAYKVSAVQHDLRRDSANKRSR